MIQIQEIKNEYTTSGTNPIMTRSALEVFVEWQREHPEIDIISIQKVDNGLFVTYKNKVEFANKKK